MDQKELNAIARILSNDAEIGCAALAAEGELYEPGELLEKYLAAKTEAIKSGQDEMDAAQDFVLTAIYGER